MGVPARPVDRASLGPAAPVTICPRLFAGHAGRFFGPKLCKYSFHIHGNTIAALSVGMLVICRFAASRFRLPCEERWYDFARFDR